jgi:4-oxalocrotonate tautomerase
MPIVEVRLVAGRAPEVKAELVRELTKAVTSTLGSAPERVRVLLTEYPPAHFNVAGAPIVVDGPGADRG